MMERAENLSALLFFLFTCLVVATIGGMITATSVEIWYPNLEKPFLTPPDWVFAPVWSILYLVIGLSGWLIWRQRAPERKKALLIFLIQLGFNLAWPFIFFGARLIGTALLEITVLLIVIIVNIIAFWRIKPLSGLLMLPYALWVAYATVLNASIWILN